MYCKKCGKEIDDDSVFCSFCGARQSSKQFLVNQTRQNSPTEIEMDSVDSKNNNEPTPESKSQNVNVSISFKKPGINRDEPSRKAEKYDFSYKKESEATVVGILLLIANLLLILIVRFEDEYSQQVFAAIFALLSVALRIIIIVWCVNIANRQNRNATGWGVFAFFLPYLALIILGMLNKLIKSTSRPSSTYQASGSNNSDLTPDDGSTYDIPSEGENQEQIEYSINNFDTLYHRNETEYSIEFSNQTNGSVFTNDSRLFFIIHRDKTKYFYKTKKAAIRALYNYITKNEINTEELAYSV